MAEDGGAASLKDEKYFDLKLVVSVKTLFVPADAFIF
jgi:hypothetical protein